MFPFSGRAPKRSDPSLGKKLRAPTAGMEEMHVSGDTNGFVLTLPR